MTDGWRDYRPAIWLTMLGIAAALLMSPPYVGAVFVGAAIGIAIRIRQRRARGERARPGPRRPRSRR